MLYSVDNYDLDDLFGTEYTDSTEERIEALRNKHIKRYRLKTIKSGEMLEADVYPVWDTCKMRQRAPKQNKSRAAQRKLNHKNAVKKVVRLINTNFTAGRDIWVHLTYDDQHLPDSIEAAQIEMTKYIRRLKNYIKKNNLPALKYLYVTEGGGDTGKRLHHHIVMTFPDRDAAEELWRGGGYPRANRLRLNDKRFKFEGMSIYISKDPTGNKRFVTSRNLEKPTIPPPADGKFTRGRVNKIISQKLDAKAVFERIYKGYEFIDIHTYVSEYVDGAYLYVRMRRRE